MCLSMYLSYIFQRVIGIRSIRILFLFLAHEEKLSFINRTDKEIIDLIFSHKEILQKFSPRR